MRHALAELHANCRKLASYAPLRRRGRLRGPLYVQLQTVDACNGACVMCPRSAARLARVCPIPPTVGSLSFNIDLCYLRASS